MNELKQKILTTAQVRAIFGISKPTELRWRDAGKLPKPISMGRRIFYQTEKINAILEG